MTEVWEVLQIQEHNTEYPEFYFCEILRQLYREIHSLRVRRSLPDAVNSSTEWNGKLEDAYSELVKGSGLYQSCSG